MAIHLGVDAGSSTIKVVLLSSKGEIIYSRYKRHRGQVRAVIIDSLRRIDAKYLNTPVKVAMTGTAAIKTAEQLDVPFIQEVKALSSWISKEYPEAGGILEMGGEDAKFVLLGKEKNPLMKMNGNCAGGTGSFIEQMAKLLNLELEEFDALAQKSGYSIPIASRCGVFAKTDMQALLNQGHSHEELACSVFHAAANQYVASLMNGLEPEGELILGGGPFTYFRSLRQALSSILPYTLTLAENSLFLSALGAASQDSENCTFESLNRFIEALEAGSALREIQAEGERPLFLNKQEYEQFLKRQADYKLPYAEKVLPDEPLFMGIDAGSTTMKFVIMNADREIVASYYTSNKGDSLESLRKGLQENEQYLSRVQAVFSTGYGRYLCREAFNLTGTLVETAAHYLAGSEFHDNINFILDIGGQDIKAMKVENNVVTDFYLNEACSSGTGSFLENFAAGMKMSLPEFVEAALWAKHPPSLGSRCTVFMNSKVKDALNDGVGANDLAAGLAYSVVKNALYKVIRVRDIRQLGDTILVQGGTFKNDAVLRTFELLTGSEVIRIDEAHIMGAYGAALHALDRWKQDSVPLSWKAHELSFADSPIREKKTFFCHGCGNNCEIIRFIFKNRREYLTGNKCDTPLKGRKKKEKAAADFFEYKYEIYYRSLIEEKNGADSSSGNVIGLPLVLSMFEHFPFFYTLLRECGFQVEVTHWTTDEIYKQGVLTQLSDNLCFPAKIVHGHVEELIKRKVNRILLPMINFETQEDEKAVNAYNCPIVSGYPEVIDSVYHKQVSIDKPLISFYTEKNLYKTVWRYIKTLGVNKDVFKAAFRRAVEREQHLRERYIQKGKDFVEFARRENRPLIIVGGRGYHIDPLIHHGILPMITNCNAIVINEEVGAALAGDVLDEVASITQWTYHNRLYKSAIWLRNSGYSPAGYIQLNSFGCGPDAVTTDEVHDLLKNSGIPYICIKLDEMSTLGAASIRVESLMYALQNQDQMPETSRSSANNTKEIKPQEKPVLLIPYLADIYTEVITSIFQSWGYEVITPSGQNFKNVEHGLHSVNNDMCYPATIVVGDVLATLKDREIDPDNNNVVVALSRTGGQCRASNYAVIMEKALRKNGYHSIPVITLSTAGSLESLSIDRYQLLKKASIGFLLADAINSMVLSTRPYEKTSGATDTLLENVKQRLQEFLSGNPDRRKMKEFLQNIISEFNDIPVIDKRNIPVGVVGEIYLKMNSFANNNLVLWLEKNGYEAVLPGFLHFLEMEFHSQKFNWHRHLKKDLNSLLQNTAKKVFFEYYKRVVKPAMLQYKRPQPDFEISDGLEDNIVSRGIQFGEAWLLPLEIMMLYRKGVRHVVSVQPFGCISNHVISKGLQKKIRDSFPGLQFLTLDYESASTNVHITNRLSLFFQ